MYKSPIDIITDNMVTEMVKEQENQVFKAIKKFGIIVDKEELIKALQYDRKQYNKGYFDGVKDIVENLLKISKTIDPKDVNELLIIRRDDFDVLIKEMVGED